jgi:hypothetical protein
MGNIRRLHGTNLAAPISEGSHPAADVSEDLGELEIPLTRLHDAPLADAGMRLVDISRVFPLFHLDEKDPRNYFFAHTDDYIANCLNYGSKVLYRLGESIEHTKKKYFIAPPSDYEKWAGICCQIIAHYNEGWGSGFHHNIEYWEIWNEPNVGPHMWGGTWSDYVRLYVVTAKRLKERFPNIKVGGPAMAGFQKEQVREFLSACRTQDAPLDFFSWHGLYDIDPDHFIPDAIMAKALLDEFGFQKAELHLNEWHYYPSDFVTATNSRPHRAVLNQAMTGCDSAAFNCAVLSALQDTPVTMANYYTGAAVIQWSDWGIFDAASLFPNKNYFSLKAFNLLTKYETRLAVNFPKERNIWVLAGRNSSGGIAILVSCLKGGDGQIHLEFGGRKVDGSEVKVLLLDSDHDLTPVEPARASGSIVTLDKPAGSAVFLVELEKYGRLDASGNNAGIAGPSKTRHELS